MGKDQNSSPQRRKILSILIGLGCGCMLIFFCLTAGYAALKLVFTWPPAGESTGPAWSPDGEFIAFTSSRDGPNDIYIMNRDGSHVTRLTNGFFSLGLFVHNWSPAWSPDGARLAFESNRNGQDDIYIMNRDGSQVRRLTNSRAEGREGAVDPAWSPDGQQVIFTLQDGSYAYGLPEDGGPLPTEDIYRIDIDGTNLTRLTDLEGLAQSPTWSPDGSQIAFVLFKQGVVDIYVMDADGTNIVQLTKDSAFESDLDWSPDGSRLVFISGDLYHNNIYVMGADGTNRQKLTDTPGLGDSSPCWSPDGRQIVFDSQEPETRVNNIFIINDNGTDLVQLTGD